MPALLAATLAGCAALTGSHPGDITVNASVITPAPSWTAPDSRGNYKPLPITTPFCRVEGTIEGNIGFELWLPANWNGRLLGAGVGGDAGVFNYNDMSRRIGEGFATVTTDSGHKASQARWMADPKARVDYEHRAVHLTAQASKALMAQFYGRGPDHSYYSGCSGGGRQALKEMQNYPGDYDGVLAGAPGPYMPLQSVRMMWFSLQQKWNPQGALSDADWTLYEKKATESCDAKDGVLDGIIENPMRCRFRTEALLCKAGQSTDCLSAPKVAMMNSIRSAMPDEQGKPMDGGLFAGVRTRPGPPSPLLRAMWADGVYNDPDWNEDSFKRTADLEAANRVMPELRADKTDISGFVRAGGKAIIYQGWADPSTNAGPTINYYAKLVGANGGLDKTDDHVRLFMVPGMYHCRGGPGVDAYGGSGQPTWPNDPSRDMLWSLIRWVEEGKAPDRVTGTKSNGDKDAFTRALCRFPLSARYDGAGAKDDAASYSCVPDPLLEKTLISQG